MLKSLLKALGLMVLVAWPAFACAVGMGGINVSSSLGRPLKAEIALVALDNVDTSSITVRLATPAEFKDAGIDYPYTLPKLTFAVETKANGEAFVKLTSTQAVNEPFVSLLLELSWPSGKMLREYTFLLDPEGFVAEQPKAAQVQPVEPVAPMAGASAVPAPAVTEAPLAAASAPEAAPAQAEGAAPAEEAAALAPASAPVQPDVTPDMEAKDMAAAAAPAKPAPAAPAKAAIAPAAETVTVKRGDTLTKIAAQARPAEVSLERMIVALYHANRREFDGKNMNRLRAGKILRVPEPDEIAKVTQSAAVREIHAQVADWHAYKQKLAAAPGESAEHAPKQEATGKIAAAVSEKAPLAKEPAKEVLKLSKGEAPGDKQVAAGATSKQEKRIAREEDAVAKEKQLQEDRMRTAELEKMRKEAGKLVELKGQPVAPTAAAPASAPVPAASAAAAAKPAAKPRPRPVMPVKTAAAPPSLLDDLLNDPLYLGGAAAALLALGGLGFVAVRRLRSRGGKKKTELRKEFKIEPAGDESGSWPAGVAHAPETAPLTRTAAPSHAAAAPLEEEVDPIGEAELFLTFGRDAQAEEVLKEALGKNPSSIPVKLKLLSIYANRKDSNSFSRYAREVQEAGDPAAWEQVAAMGRIVDPTNPTYGGSPGAQAPSPSAAPEFETSVDFDLGFGKPAEAAPAAHDFSMDFDVTGTHPGAAALETGTHAADELVDLSGVLPGEVARPAQETPMDFDISAVHDSEELMKAVRKAEMDFDISGTLQQEEIMKSAQKSTMDFDVTGGTPEVKTAEAPPALDFGDLVFEMPSTPPKAAETPHKPAPAADEGMAFTLDFPMGEVAEAPASKAGTESKLDIDFADISLDLGAPTAASGGEGKDDHWHEVATKLDLAKAYQEMGDGAGAREILDEVLRDGDQQQRDAAQNLLQQLSA